MKNLISNLLLAFPLGLLILSVGCHRRLASLEGSGIIEVTEVVVRTKVAGRVMSLSFEEGQSVSAGQALARIEAKEFEAQKRQFAASLKAARQQISLAEASLDLAEDSYRRNLALHDSGLVTDQQFFQIETQLRSARSQWEAARSQYHQARAGLELAEIRLAEAEITAPCSGVILEKNVEPGELALSGSAICKIGDLGRPYLRIYLSEKEYGRVKLGQRARITVDSYPGRLFEGRVVSIASQAEFTPKDIQTKEERTKLVFGVKILLDNPRDELKPGMPADAAIMTD
jgi:HlyD family secretion protein